jgi:hypothetical protein
MDFDAGWQLCDEAVRCAQAASESSGSTLPARYKD